jgi:hypothetical protein
MRRSLIEPAVMPGDIREAAHSFDAEGMSHLPSVGEEPESAGAQQARKEEEEAIL